MRPLAAFPAHEARALDGVVFDLDGTLLTSGALELAAYRALHALRDAGLRLVACTGRPAGWGAVIARQWPIELAVVENGALAFRREGARLVTQDDVDAVTRSDRRRRLEAIVSSLRERFSEIPLADDHHERRTDVTFDVRETCDVPAERVAALRAEAARLGARTFESSIHVHVTLDAADKASGTVRCLARTFGVGTTSALGRYAFVGDSANDEACFSAFRTTFGVANVAPWVRVLSRPPSYVTSRAEGDGFAEFAHALLAARGRSA